MKDKALYVIQLDNGMFINTVGYPDKQLRKAKIYTSIKQAEEWGQAYLERYTVRANTPNIGFRIREIEMRLKDEKEIEEPEIDEYEEGEDEEER